MYIGPSWSGTVRASEVRELTLQRWRNGVPVCFGCDIISLTSPCRCLAPLVSCYVLFKARVSGATETQQRQPLAKPCSNCSCSASIWSMMCRLETSVFHHIAPFSMVNCVIVDGMLLQYFTKTLRVYYAAVPSRGCVTHCQSDDGQTRSCHNFRTKGRTNSKFGRST